MPHSSRTSVYTFIMEVTPPPRDKNQTNNVRGEILLWGKYYYVAILPPRGKFYYILVFPDRLSARAGATELNVLHFTFSVRSKVVLSTTSCNSAVLPPTLENGCSVRLTCHGAASFVKTSEGVNALGRKSTF